MSSARAIVARVQGHDLKSGMANLRQMLEVACTCCLCGNGSSRTGCFNHLGQAQLLSPSQPGYFHLIFFVACLFGRTGVWNMLSVKRCNWSGQGTGRIPSTAVLQGVTVGSSSSELPLTSDRKLWKCNNVSCQSTETRKQKWGSVTAGWNVVYICTTLRIYKCIGWQGDQFLMGGICFFSSPSYLFTWVFSTGSSC